MVSMFLAKTLFLAKTQTGRIDRRQLKKPTAKTQTRLLKSHPRSPISYIYSIKTQAGSSEFRRLGSWAMDLAKRTVRPGSELR